MTILYVSFPANKVAVVHVDDVSGELVEIIQTVDGIVDDDQLVAAAAAANKSLKPQTEWIDRHPKFSLLYALTSFWNKAEASLTTFRIDETTGKLTKLGTGVSMAGYEAAHGRFSLDASTYTVAMHNGGKIVFFDSSKDEAVGPPLQVIELPLDDKVYGTRVHPPDDKFMGIGFPSCHAVEYASSGNFLITVDTGQNNVLTYAVDGQGRLKGTDPIISVVKCHLQNPLVGWFKQILCRLTGLGGGRPRRAVLHPNGRFLYVLQEFHNTIQVFAIDQDGHISPEALQEIVITALEDPKNTKWWIGPVFLAAAEMEATDDGLLVSVRGEGFGGRCESGVRHVAFRNDGARLELGDSRIETPASVRHFCRQGKSTLWVGLNSAKLPYLQKYAIREKEEESCFSGDYKAVSFELLGEANVGDDVFCVVPK